MGTGLGPTLEFYALVSTELQRVDLGLWNDGDSYKHQQVMADAIKSPAIPASDEQSQMIYIHQPSSASSLTNEDSSGNNNNISDNNVMNNNEINMLIEQSLDQQNDAVENQSNEGGIVGTPRQTTALSFSSGAQYVNAPCGLFPLSLSKTAKTSQISRLKFKFKFLGKFMAKAVMDSRMVSGPRIFITFHDLIFISTLSWTFRSQFPSTAGCWPKRTRSAWLTWDRSLPKCRALCCVSTK